MLRLFRRDPVKKLQKRYEQTLERAMQRQRSGDIRNYSLLSAEADALRVEIMALQRERDG